VDGAQVVYIGKATALRKRIAQYRRFGAGTSDAHWGGRYIWQLQDQADLLVAWRVTAAAETARAVETALIGHFMARYRGRMPFANLRP
jgi:excinuclease UvrABC nuclease subunit